MGYEDDPIVDSSSERSEASVLAVRRVLSQKNGFICREDKPDFGVDINVELIADRRATGQRFPVQLKSAMGIPRVTLDGQEYVWHQFSTARLGYLCRCPPSYGLLVLYDDETDTAYFDFVEEIYARLSARKDSVAWQRQDTVRIHVPVANALTPSSARKIGETFRRRFSNHALLVNDHGPDYGIPVISSGAPRPDPADPRSPVQLLREYGATLLNNRELRLLVNLLQNVSHGDLSSSSQLACIAAMAFSMSGRLLDAEYFIRRADAQRGQLRDDERTLLDLHKAYIDFHFGRTTPDQYIQLLTALRAQASMPVNELGIAVQLDYLCVLRDITFKGERDHDELVRQLLATEKAISNAQLEAQARNLLLLRWAGNMHQLAMNVQVTQITSLRARGVTFRPPSMQERADSARTVLMLVRRAATCIEKVFADLQTDSEGAQPLIAPRLRAQLASTFFSFAFNSYILSAGQPPANNNARALFAVRFRNAVDAYNAFIGEGTLAEAYTALTVALEIGILFTHQFSESIDGFDEIELTSRIERLGNELGKPHWSSLVRSFEIELPSIINPDSRGFTDLAPEKEREFAEECASAWGLPADRVDNIVADIRACRNFAAAFPDPNSELIQDLGHTLNPNTMYQRPPTYIGWCKQCGFRTTRSESVKRIVAEFTSEHRKSCSKSRPHGA